MLNFIALIIGFIIAPFVFVYHIFLNLFTVVFGVILASIPAFSDRAKKNNKHNTTPTVDLTSQLSNASDDNNIAVDSNTVSAIPISYLFSFFTYALSSLVTSNFSEMDAAATGVTVFISVTIGFRLGNYVGGIVNANQASKQSKRLRLTGFCFAYFFILAIIVGVLVVDKNNKMTQLGKYSSPPEGLDWKPVVTQPNIEKYYVTPNATQSPQPTPTPGNTPASTVHKGTVVETMNSGGYTYAEVDENGQKAWVAAMQTKVKVGDTVEFADAPPMVNFQSKTLKRTFDKLIFSPGLAVTKSLSSEVPEVAPQPKSTGDSQAVRALPIAHKRHFKRHRPATTTKAAVAVVFLRNDEVIECQAVTRTKKGVHVVVNKSLVLDFDRSEVDMAKTFR